MSNRHVIRTCLLISLFASVPSTAFSKTPASPSSDGIQYFGEAYGSLARVSSAVQAGAGKSFPVWLGTCGTLRPPVTHTNTGGSVNARPFAVTGTIDNAVSATDILGTQTSKSTATVHHVSVLSGLITAQELKAVSATSHTAAGFSTSGAGSSLANLVVAGIPILLAPAPNTRINLAGYGYVILNEQVPAIGPNSASFDVIMLHVFVTLSNPLVPVGTEIVVAHARSRLNTTGIAGTLEGFAFGTSANLRTAAGVLSGRSALVTLGCLGTHGAVRTNEIASVSLAPHLFTDLVSNTASGVVNTASASGETTSTVAGLDLLSSLVTADLIKADAHSFTDGNTFTFTDDGSRFVNLSVRGFPQINDEVPPNTRISIAGLGTLWLRRLTFTPNSIRVKMIELIVDQANVYGLPIGTNIRVGVAHAGAH